MRKQTDLQVEVGDKTFDRFEIVSPRDDWPAGFERVAHELCREIGAYAVHRIDHIGSTSIPGVPSKDRIDIQVTTTDLSIAIDWIAPLGALGYIHERLLGTDHQPADLRGREKLFFRREAGRPFVNLHIREKGRANWLYAMLFRDYLHTHPAVADAYGETKARLAAVTDGRRWPYSYVKEPICDVIYEAAREWADNGHWNRSLYEESNVAKYRPRG